MRFHKLSFVTSLAIPIILLCTEGYSQDIESGRVSYFLFNGNAQDEEATNHGIVHGAVPTTDRFGNLNNAYFFDGIDDFIEVPHHASLDFSNNQDFTISVWVKISENQMDMEGTNNEILGKWNAFVTSGYPFATGIRVLQ